MIPYLLMEIKNLIKKYLREQKISQTAFAKKLGVRPETVWRYVHGTSWPTRKREKRILRIINGSQGR
jgi:transcriptional regulator with XRE-family HTH domain